MSEDKKTELRYIFLLLLGCILFIFSNISLYPLIDIDETRYVNISKYMYLTKEYLTPILNFEPFLEKPPLYFWLNIIAFKIFNNQSLFVCRFMTALAGSIGVFATYFFVRKISNDRLLGFLSASVLLTSTWFIIFSHIAILDLNFMVFSMLAIYFAIMPLFEEKKSHKKFYWHLAYFFMAFSILAKGLIGAAIPMGVVFFTYLAFKKIKELFNPIYIIPGIIIFLLFTLPWHIMMYKTHGSTWVDMYIIKHHFARLLTSDGLGRKQPFLFYLPIMLLGLIPWMTNFVAVLIKDVKQLFEKNILNNDKILIFSYIYLIFTFIFFSCASTKLPTYILTLFPALAIIIGNFWNDAIKNNRSGKYLVISNYVNSSLFLTAALLALIVAYLYKNVMPNEIQFYIQGALDFSIPALSVILLISIASLIANKKKRFIQVFVLNMVIMLVGTITVFGFGMPYYTSFAQDELVEYAKYIEQQKNSQTVTYGFSAKYSILNPHKKIKYIIMNNKNNYKELVKYIRKNRKKNIYILTRKEVKNFDNKRLFRKIKQGRVYKLYVDTLK